MTDRYGKGYENLRCAIGRGEVNMLLDNFMNYWSHHEVSEFQDKVGGEPNSRRLVSKHTLSVGIFLHSFWITG